MLNRRRNLAAILVGLLIAAQTTAAQAAPQTGTEVQITMQLAAHIETQAKIENMEERRAAVTEENPAPLSWQLGAARFTLSGLIEAEASLTHVEGGDEEDDLHLCTVQIGLDAEFTSWLGGHVIGLWEEEDTEPMMVDEVVLSLTSPWQLGGQTPALHLGRQYLPFGRFDSAMISDPLTLELGETHTTAALLGLEGERWSASLGAFEGSGGDDNDGVDSWVAAVKVIPRAGLVFGASWLSDLAESDADLVQGEGLYRDDVPAWSASAILQHGPYGLAAEYLAAAKRFKPEQVDAGEALTGGRPEAWYLELSWQPVESVQLAARYEAARNFQAEVSRYGATLSYGLCNYALLAVEYLHADADNSDPEHAFTAQLAVEF